MGVSIHDPLCYTDSAVNGTWYGIRIKYYSPMDNTYVLEDGSPVDAETVKKIRRYLAIDSYNATPAPKPYKPTKKSLQDTRDQRFYRRMVRLKEKMLQRRLRFLGQVACFVGLFWGSLQLIVLSSYLLRWTVHVVLG